MKVILQIARLNILGIILLNTIMKKSFGLYIKINIKSNFSNYTDFFNPEKSTTSEVKDNNYNCHLQLLFIKEKKIVQFNSNTSEVTRDLNNSDFFEKSLKFQS